MSETPTEELLRRAKRLLKLDGVWVDEDQRELILEGWTKWAVILVSNRLDDLHNTVYTAVYYDTPAPYMLCSDDPNDVAYFMTDDGGIRFIPMVLDVLRKRMVLDDLADV